MRIFFCLVLIFKNTFMAILATWIACVFLRKAKYDVKFVLALSMLYVLNHQCTVGFFFLALTQSASEEIAEFIVENTSMSILTTCALCRM